MQYATLTMYNSYDKLLQATLANYRRGFTKPVQITPEISGECESST
jgi:hypothetical protein